MKKLLLTAFALVAFGFSVPAHAIFSNGQIERIIRIDPTTCGIEIGILEDANSLLPSLSSLNIGNHLLADLLVLLDLELGLGDHVLAATVSFEEASGIQADIELDDDDCDLLHGGNVVELLRGLLGNIVDSVTLPNGFGDLTALNLDPDGDGLLLVNLADLEISVANSDGDTGSVGGNPGTSTPGSNDGNDSGSSAGGDNGATVGPLGDGTSAASGGCSIAVVGAGSSMAYGLLLAIFNGMLVVRFYSKRD